MGALRPCLSNLHLDPAMSGSFFNSEKGGCMYRKTLVVGVAICSLLASIAAQADPFVGSWVNRSGTEVETVVIEPDDGGYRAVSTLDPDPMWGPVTIRLVAGSESLLLDLKTRQDRWVLLPDGTAKSYLRHKPKIFERLGRSESDQRD